MRIGIFGRGRLGSAMHEAAAAAGVDIAWTCGRGDSTASLAPVDAALDASAAAAVDAHVAWALENRIQLVIGVTGFESAGLRERIGERIGAVIAPNFSLTVAFLSRLVGLLGKFAAADPSKDPYILEHHHARKKDAPSGTARLLADVLLASCPRKKRWKIAAPGSPVAEDELDIAVLRAGHTYSTHTIGIDAPGEILEIHHASRTALPYGEGAITAARWIQGRRGLFTMADVAADALDPVFGGSSR